jgi:hypothetical protein
VALHGVSFNESDDEHLTRGGDESFMPSTKLRTETLSIFFEGLLFEVGNVGAFDEAGLYVNKPFEVVDDIDAMWNIEDVIAEGSVTPTLCFDLYPMLQVY